MHFAAVLLCVRRPRRPQPELGSTLRSPDASYSLRPWSLRAAVASDTLMRGCTSVRAAVQCPLSQSPHGAQPLVNAVADLHKCTVARVKSKLQKQSAANRATAACGGQRAAPAVQLPLMLRRQMLPLAGTQPADIRPCSSATARAGREAQLPLRRQGEVLKQAY